MSKHTPGPWRVEGVRGSAIDVAASDGTCICVPLRAGGSCEANADLIAAAPDLLFHLLAAANYVDALGGDSKSYRQAIARATGGQNP